MVEFGISLELQQAFECTICYEEYKVERMPCTLPCGHSICFQCAFKLVKNSMLVCPMDKKELKVIAFSGNKSLMNLIGTIRAHYSNKIWTPIRQSIIRYTKPCNNFLLGKKCKFGENCKYMHVSEEFSSEDSDDSYLDNDFSYDESYLEDHSEMYSDYSRDSFEYDDSSSNISYDPYYDRY